MKIQSHDVAAVQVVTERSATQISDRNSVVASRNVAEDRTTLKSDSTLVQSLVSQALKSPDIQQDKIDAIRQALSAGEYKIAPGKVADAIIATSEK
jgi:negative regulator of flagellin synthesis FlgM